jgi:DNA-binding transcriptional ArsR family regulator
MNDKEKPNFWSVTPAYIRYHEDLSDFAKLLYSEIMALSNKNGYCHANNNYFEVVFKKSQPTISKSITDLEELDLIKVGSRDGSEPRKITPQVKIDYTPPKKKSLGEVKETFSHNNTSNNNTSNTISKDIVELPKNQLPIKGNSSLQRVINFYSSVWKERYGRYPVSTNYALLGKQLKPTLASVTEYQLALVVMQYFYWKGTTGSDEFGYKRLVDKAFPLHWLPTMVDEILVYWRNEMGIDPDDEKEVKRVVDQKINEMQIRTTP